MWTKHHKKRHFGRLVMPVLTLGFLSYFGYHSMNGELGLKAIDALEQQRVERKSELAQLVFARQELERQVQLMSDGSLEKDILDEKARYGLNVSRSDEIVIFH